MNLVPCLVVLICRKRTFRDEIKYRSNVCKI
jgi:hypothetical protein